MDWKFFCGILGTEATAQLGLAATLGYAFLLVRLEFEHLLFALLSASVAAQSIAAISLTWPTHPDPYLASVYVHGILALASAFHLHYVLVLADTPKRTKYASLGYTIAAVYFALMVSNSIWPRPSAIELARVVPVSIYPPLAMPPVALGVSFYGVTLAELGFCQFILWHAIRRGRRDITLVLLGTVAVTLAAFHDVAVMMKVVRNVFLLSHSFCIYGFFVGLSLLLRYRKLVVGYASTTSSLSIRTEELRKSHADLEIVQRDLSSKKRTRCGHRSRG
jgi:hypothetical protein